MLFCYKIFLFFVKTYSFLGERKRMIDRVIFLCQSKNGSICNFYDKEQGGEHNAKNTGRKKGTLVSDFAGGGDYDLKFRWQ